MGPDCADLWAGFLGEAAWWRGKRRAGEVFLRPAALVYPASPGDWLKRKPRRVLAVKRRSVWPARVSPSCRWTVADSNTDAPVVQVYEHVALESHYQSLPGTNRRSEPRVSPRLFCRSSLAQVQTVCTCNISVVYPLFSGV